MGLVEKLIAFENGELAEYQAVELLTELVASGLIGQLQGSYGRAAAAYGLLDEQQGPKCQGCGTENCGWVRDPYDKAIHDETNYKYLCDECYYRRARDI